MRFALYSLFIFSLSQAQTYLDPKGPIYTGTVAAEASYLPINIKVVSYNIGFSKKLDAVIATLKSEKLRNAQIIFLQEVVGVPDGSGNTAEIIARELNMNYVFIPSQIHPDLVSDYGSAILSRFPIDEIKKIILPGKHLRLRTQRAVVGARVTIGVRTIRAYSVHLENMFLDTFSPAETSRLWQLSTLLGSVPKNERVVIGGDFNAINPSGLGYLVGMFWSEGYTRASSFLPSENKLPIGIDHIFTRGTQVLDYGTVYEFSGSDHAPVWAELAL